MVGKVVFGPFRFYFLFKIEAHENQLNNTPLLCDSCDYRCFTRANLKIHCKSRHPEKLPKKAKKKGRQEFTTERERRQKILDTIKTHPTWSYTKVAKIIGVSRKTVMALLKNNGSIERRKFSGKKPTPPRVIELEKKIAHSFQQDPTLSLRRRAKIIGVGHTTIERVAKKLGFKAEVDESSRIFQCKLCPLKYAHSTTLTAHMKLKHSDYLNKS